MKQAGTAPVAQELERTRRAWTIVYVPEPDGIGGGYKLAEIALPESVVESASVRTWPPELLSIVIAKLASRVHACLADPDNDGEVH